MQTVQHDYITQNGKVVRETVTTDGTVTAVMDFIYDESGTPFALKCSTNGGSSFTTYYYVVNLQGDVVKLVNAGGTAYATYTYNAWGEVLTATGTMASINPLRYRGYYYDTETGFYYLQSRYYDPANHRFINADAPEYSTMSAYGLNNSNLFAYCRNNPVAYGDENGEWLNFLIGAVVGAVVGAVTTAVEAVKEGGWDALTEGKTWAKIGVSAACGAVSGVVAASGVGVGASIAYGAATGAVESVGHQLIDNGTVDSKKLFADTVEGAIGGLFGGKGAIYGNKYMNRQVSRLIEHSASDGLKKAVKFGWKMTKNYSKQFILPTIWGITKSTFGSKVSEKIFE